MKGVAIDPGKHACGVAVFEGGKLQRAWFVETHPIPGIEELPSRLMSRAVESALSVCECQLPCECLEIESTVIEVPVFYDTKHRKGSQVDLAVLHQVAGALVVELPSDHFELIEPWQWKGQVPKKIMNDRTKAELTDEERALVELPSAKSKHHNVWDAVGIGLWKWRHLR